MSQEKPISGFRDRLAALRSKAYRVQALALSVRWCVELMDSDSLKGFVGCTTFSAMFEVLCVQMFVSFKKTFWN
ncbi:hypothetical protein KXD40_005283 [Peronospora effusa]|nr:hypothetical protein KXD40_005277 [Peronospora effusa]UIZ22351.1 hypothetical protein KXD40_005285 [Peronospora effusa]UIZ22355.1 hypothetical protein KXD40_005283 [Peronospora effusa]